MTTGTIRKIEGPLATVQLDDGSADRVRADQVRLARRPLYGPNGQIITDPSKFERP